MIIPWSHEYTILLFISLLTRELYTYEYMCTAQITYIRYKYTGDYCSY